MYGGGGGCAKNRAAPGYYTLFGMLSGRKKKKRGGHSLDVVTKELWSGGSRSNKFGQRKRLKGVSARRGSEAGGQRLCIYNLRYCS